MRSAEDEPLAAGTVVDGRYRVIRELGAGGMGRVYEAEHMFIRRPMALKLLRTSIAGPEAAARMVQEATLAGQVPHAAVVRVFDCAALPDGRVYVAMELLRGESLEEALRRSIDAAAALAVLAEVARGLAAVHRVGVVHRDIKPGNIFLADGPEGVQAKLLDFGVAKALAGGPELAAGMVRTQAGEVLGTPYYVAPEQARGGAIDGRADLYSLGVVLYEVLTGELPFVGESFVAILAQHMRTPPLDPRQAAPGREIPDGAARLAMRLLAKEPDARPGDGDAVADEIAALLIREGEALRRLWTGAATAAATEVRRTGLRVRGAEVGTVRLGEASAAAVQGEASGTVRLADVSSAGTVRLADGSSAGTVRLADGSSAGTVRLADASAAAMRVTAEGASAAADMSPGTGMRGERSDAALRATVGRRWWLVGGLVGAMGGVGVWSATRPAVEAAIEAAPAVVPAARVEPVVRGPAPALPAKVGEPAVPAVESGEETAVVAPPTTAPVRPAKGKKHPRGGGPTREPAKAPAKTGGDPPLKPDVYDNE